MSCVSLLWNAPRRAPVFDVSERAPTLKVATRIGPALRQGPPLAKAFEPETAADSFAETLRFDNCSALRCGKGGRICHHCYIVDTNNVSPLASVVLVLQCSGSFATTLRHSVADNTATLATATTALRQMTFATTRRQFSDSILWRFTAVVRRTIFKTARQPQTSVTNR